MTVLHAHASPEALRMVRALLFGLWGIKLLFDPVQDLALLPVSVFNPPAPLAFFPRAVYSLMLLPASLLAFRFGAAALLLLAARGCCFLWLAPLCCVLLTVYQSLLRGFGHLNHAEIAPLLAVYVVTAFAWADKVERVHRPAYPLIGIVAVLCLTYTLVGIHRLMHGGIHIFLSNAIIFYTVECATRLTYFDFSLGKLVYDYPLLGHGMRAGFIAVTAAESLSLFCLVSRRFRHVFLFVMIPFHVLSLVVMNIAFFENLLLLLLLIERRPGQADVRHGSCAMR